MLVSVDIPHEELRKYMEAAVKKQGICRVLPRGRFAILDGRNDFEFYCLVCTPMDMGGEATGVAASSCENCIK